MGVFGILVLVLHVLVAAAICGLVLLQHGKGADMGAAFGSGSSGSLFGASGSANFLSRSTGVLAGVFFLTSLGLTWYTGHRAVPTSVMDTHKVEQPAAPPAGLPPPNSVPGPAQAPSSPVKSPADSKAGEIPK